MQHNPAVRSLAFQLHKQVLGSRGVSSYRPTAEIPLLRLNTKRKVTAALFATAGASTLVYAALSNIKSAEVGSRDYSSTVKITDTASHPRNYKMLVADPESADTMLKSNETSTYLTKGSGNSGILSYHFNQVASNSPIEDDHVESLTTHQSTDWAFFGVFDGHSGWTTSDKLKRELVPYVAAALNSSPGRDNVSIKQALQTGFLNLDTEIVHASAQRVLQGKDIPKAAAVAQLMPALSGSCALLALYDAAAQSVHVAVTGDSRAIYARQGAGGWIIKALSEDQTGSTTSEVARLRAEHPNEENVVRNGRILGGLEPSRAFGDSRYKWSISTQSQIADRFYGRRPPAALVSPPYVTARPEVTSTKINLDEQGFMVMGSDGLYEMLTNEEITELVVGWKQKFDPKASASSWLPAFLGSPSPPKIINEDDARSGQKKPHVKSKKQFVYEDDNIATHIIRNALGGGDTNRLYGLLSLPYPLSRSYRDDISVTVVFFGHDTDRRSEATPIKAKL
ncbi:protein of unknown function [Taphrina deformans PYCC 5710]|uniref:PPM-type phosphatase domain-containing protein n=1 Tax=Taphrina deformans (strain PYCC 5710 / ATCC 11124 / CBS 356.35 / IMI 108563 / JCM 9778 / NBRC 8474) TaxID=1097556 RepID=R4XNB4_TAPDE|nr:protein of unknown function [Taphrina deformans PYCC 5710]|eukprot:CCG84734.1 protein of unknown function [Taphrina deformans PYCC 5710]